MSFSTMHSSTEHKNNPSETEVKIQTQNEIDTQATIDEHVTIIKKIFNHSLYSLDLVINFSAPEKIRNKISNLARELNKGIAGHHLLLGSFHSKDTSYDFIGAPSVASVKEGYREHNLTFPNALENKLSYLEPLMEEMLQAGFISEKKYQELMTEIRKALERSSITHEAQAHSEFKEQSKPDSNSSHAFAAKLETNEQKEEAAKQEREIDDFMLAAKNHIRPELTDQFRLFTLKVCQLVSANKTQSEPLDSKLRKS